MLYHVRMDVRPPHDVDPERFERLKAEEKAKAQELQRSGKWRHLWRIAGLYSNISIFDVADHDELHAILSGLPLFPFMEITVTPLARHPSAIDSEVVQRSQTRDLIRKGEHRHGVCTDDRHPGLHQRTPVHPLSDHGARALLPGGRGRRLRHGGNRVHRAGVARAMGPDPAAALDPVRRRPRAA